VWTRAAELTGKASLAKSKSASRAKSSAANSGAPLRLVSKNDTYDTQRPAMRANRGLAIGLTSASQPTGNFELTFVWRGGASENWFMTFGWKAGAGGNRSLFRVRFTVWPDEKSSGCAIKSDISKPVLNASMTKPAVKLHRAEQNLLDIWTGMACALHGYLMPNGHRSAEKFR
jgi:hypothetical protein